MQHFNASPHVCDDNMLQLYQHGDGFIFETMVVSAKPSRQKWTDQALDRMRLYAGQRIRQDTCKVSRLIPGRLG